MQIHRCDHCGTRRPRSTRAVALHERAHHYDLLRERLSVTRLARVIPLHRAAA